MRIRKASTDTTLNQEIRMVRDNPKVFQIRHVEDMYRGHVQVGNSAIDAFGHSHIMNSDG
jgi:hypothetical protein